MGRSFYNCCGTDSSNNNESKNTPQNKSKKSKLQSHTVPQSYSKEPDCRKLDPKLNMIHPYTIQLLTDIGELKSYQHNTIEYDKFQQDLKVHADILARLENPMAFQ